MNQKHLYRYLFSLLFAGLLILPELAQADIQKGFVFGNHIDSHQSTYLVTKNGVPVSLIGSLYIFFTGETDPASHLPIARHPRGASQNETCGVDVNCVTGWLINAVPGAGKFLFHTGVNGEDHPVWLVNRTQIPQPGDYTHFHWITSSSIDPRAPAVPAECNAQDAGDLEGVAEDVVCPGWFLQITAVRAFAFQHDNEIIPVRLGRDNATHLNLLTNYAEVPGITSTR